MRRLSEPAVGLICIMAGVRVRVVLKVAVVGTVNTGKSSIIKRYVDGKFLRPEPTTAVDFRQKDVTVNGMTYSYEIWDVPNWTHLDNLGLNFWRDICGCALVFDVTKAPSFCILDKLCSSVYRVAKREDIPVVVVGSMADREQAVREVPAEMAENWCGKVGASYFEVSAKTGAGVDELFVALAEKAVVFYQHHHATDQQTGNSRKWPSRFSIQLPLLKKVTSKLKFGRSESVSATVHSDRNEQDDDSSGLSRPPSTSVFSSLPVHVQVPWFSKKTAEPGGKDPVAVKKLEELQRQLEVEESRSRMLQEKVDRHEMEMLERTHSLESLEKQLKELRSDMQKKVALREAVQASNQTLQKQVAELQSEQKKIHQASSCYEVSGQEVKLDMTKMVGTGAWGYVVEGNFRGQKVAVKCLHNLIQQPHFLQIVRREIDIMAQVRHPHLLLFIAVVLDSATGPLIVTELLDTSLRRAYEQNQLQQSNTMSIFCEVAAALNYLHLQGSGIIHRDVSSANVLLERKSELFWKAKLSDFGSANLIRHSSTVGPGAMVYAAPEVRTVSDESQTPKVDVYSFGVLMTEVLLRQFPSIEEFKAMLDKIKAVSHTVYPLIHNCTRTAPAERPTMALLLEQLNKLTLRAPDQV